MCNVGVQRFHLGAVICRENCIKRLALTFLGLLAVAVVFKELTTELNPSTPTPVIEAVAFPKPSLTKEKVEGNTSLNLFEPDVVPDAFEQATLFYSSGSAVAYVYNASDLVSRHILNVGTWKSEWVAALEAVFSADVSLHLIDVGCGLGVDTIVATMYDRRVVAVDANFGSVRRLWKALLDNQKADRVILLHNGISDRYGDFSVMSPEVENIGHSVLVPAKPGDTNTVRSILMDDLLRVIDFDRAVLKMNIEGHEYEALHSADQLFVQVDIPFVIMEWKSLRTNTDANVPNFVINFFQRFGYHAFDSLSADSPLDAAFYETWPQDIVWKKYDG